jgi:hypothetical protein
VAVSDWEPATEAEAAMRDALRAGNQEQYFRLLARTELILPVDASLLAGHAPVGWGTWTTESRTHVLAFTSPAALDACLAEHAGTFRQVQFPELAASWPDLEWWLAVNPSLPIEGYLPAWFVAQISRGDVRLPGRTLGARARMEQATALRSGTSDAAGQSGADRPPPRGGGLLSERLGRPGGGRELSRRAELLSRHGFSRPGLGGDTRPGNGASGNSGAGNGTSDNGASGNGAPVTAAPVTAAPVTGAPANDAPVSGAHAAPVSGAPTAGATQRPSGDPASIYAPSEISADAHVSGHGDAPEPEYDSGRFYGTAPDLIAPAPRHGLPDAPAREPGMPEPRATPSPISEPQPTHSRAAEQAASRTEVAADDPQPVAAAPAPAGAFDFTPANRVEESLLDAAGGGSTDNFLSTLLLARVLVPGPRDKALANIDQWRREQIDGQPYLVVFTSAERLSEHLGEDFPATWIKFTQLINAWPQESLAFSVNPGTPIGATLPGSQIVALAAWATDEGLNDEQPEAEPAASMPEPPRRGSAPPPSTGPVVMQKTISAQQAPYYLDRGYDRISGFVHRANEVAHLRTPIELYDALGLNYSDSPFKPDDAEVFVLRWAAHRGNLYRIPYGGQHEAAMHAMKGWMIERSPFRGNGFAPSESRDVIAEFKVDSVRLPHGAELWRVDRDGNEKLVAMFDADGPEWRRVGEQ